MLHFNHIFCLVTLIVTAVSSYRIEFISLEDIPEWHGDISTTCLASINPQSITHIQITKDRDSDSSSDVLLSSNSDCSTTSQSVRLGEGLHSLTQELYPGIESMSLKVIPRETWRDVSEAISTPSLVWFTTTSAVITMNTIRFTYGEAFSSAAAVVGRPLWAFVSSPFISTVIVAHGVAYGTAYAKNWWDTATYCEKLKEVQPKLDLLKTVSEVVSLEDMADVKVIVTMKDGSGMTVTHEGPQDDL